MPCGDLFIVAISPLWIFRVIVLGAREDTQHIFHPELKIHLPAVGAAGSYRLIRWISDIKYWSTLDVSSSLDPRSHAKVWWYLSYLDGAGNSLEHERQTILRSEDTQSRATSSSSSLASIPHESKCTSMMFIICSGKATSTYFLRFMFVLKISSKGLLHVNISRRSISLHISFSTSSICHSTSYLFTWTHAKLECHAIKCNLKVFLFFSFCEKKKRENHTQTNTHTHAQC